MANKKISAKGRSDAGADLRVKTIAELTKEVVDIEKDIFAMRIDNTRRKLLNTTAIKRKRDIIAKMKTIIREKELIKNG